MKHLKFFVPITLLMFILGSCNKQAEFDIEGGQALQPRAEYNQIDLTNVDFTPLFSSHDLNSTKSNTTADAYTNDINGNIVGTSTMHRNHKKFTAHYNASDAPNLDISGHACTLWALVWNSPDEAFSGVHPYAMYRVGGNVAGGNDQINITGVVKEGQTDDYYQTGPESTPLTDAENAFIVLIVKSHGPMDPAEMPGQILTFGGGCDGDEDGGGPLGPCYEYTYSLQF